VLMNTPMINNKYPVLSDYESKQIIRLRKTYRMTQQKLAKMYGVTVYTIRTILKGT